MRLTVKSPEARYVLAVVLNGERLDVHEHSMLALDTDEGWVDFLLYEFIDGSRRIKMSEWRPDPSHLGSYQREPLTERRYGKVEVLFKVPE